MEAPAMPAPMTTTSVRMVRMFADAFAAVNGAPARIPARSAPLATLRSFAPRLARPMTDPTPLWRPSAERIERAAVTRYRRWLKTHRGLDFPDYESLWHWSVTEIEAFWESLWQFFEIRSHSPYTRVLDRRVMPGAKWFEGATLNYAEHMLAAALRPDAATRPALILTSEVETTRGTLMGRARRPGGRAHRHARCAGREARRPRRLVHAEHSGERRGAGGGREPGRRLVELLAGHGAGQRARPVPPDRAESPVRRGRLPLRRQGLRPARRGARTRGATALARSGRSSCRTSIRRRRLDLDDAGPASVQGDRRWRRRSRSPPPRDSRRCPSTIRCGSSIPPAPPACPSRSCTATAAW